MLEPKNLAPLTGAFLMSISLQAAAQQHDQSAFGSSKFTDSPLQWQALCGAGNVLPDLVKLSSAGAKQCASDEVFKKAQKFFTLGQAFELVVVAGQWTTLAETLKTAGTPIDQLTVSDGGMTPHWMKQRNFVITLTGTMQETDDRRVHRSTIDTPDGRALSGRRYAATALSLG